MLLDDDQLLTDKLAEAAAAHIVDLASLVLGANRDAEAIARGAV